MTNVRKLASPIVAALALAAAGCDPAARRDLDATAATGVFIEYNIVQSCGTLASGPPNTSDVGSGRLLQAGPFYVYRIRSIANRGTAARDFHFDSRKFALAADRRSRRYTGAPVGPLPALVVPAGGEWRAGGRIIVKLEGPVPTSTNLAYERSASDPPVVLLPRPQSPARRDACQVSDLAEGPEV